MVDQANTLMLKADAEEDPLQRMRDYNAAEQLLVVDIAWIPLYQTKVWWQTQSRIHNYTVASFGLTPLDVWTSVYIADPELRGIAGPSRLTCSLPRHARRRGQFSVRLRCFQNNRAGFVRLK